MSATTGDGATTVAATLVLAARAGIPVFATGGIGGVHREPAFDESADLPTLARTYTEGLLVGAKGNCGVIMSQLARACLGALDASAYKRMVEDVVRIYPSIKVVVTTGWAQVDLKKGEFHKANFIIGNCDSPATLADVVATQRGFALKPRRAREVVVLARPVEEKHAAVLAFLADGEGRTHVPSVINLDIASARGEFHIKTAHIEGIRYIGVKVASG